MGRKRVPPDQKRVKFHLANVMVPAWVDGAIGKEAGRTGETIKTLSERALTEFATTIRAKPTRSL